jgi:hypothetical protein
MRELINKIKNRMEESLRRLCAPVSSGTRILIIMIVTAAFAVVNFYILFRATYNIGREDKKWEWVDSKVRIPEAEPEPEASGEGPEAPQREKEKFFYKPFNSKQNDTAGKG